MPYTTHLLTLAIDSTVDPRLADRLAEALTTIIPGSHAVAVHTTETTFSTLEWDDNGVPLLPLDEDDAESLIDDDGFVSIVTTVDQEQFMTQRAYGATTEGADDEHNLLHETVFSFGLPYDSSVEILGVDHDAFIVRYSTKIDEFLS